MTEKGSKAVSEGLVKAMLASDLEGFVAQYADDAVLYGPGPVVQSVGRDAIRREMASFFAAIKAESFDWDDRSETVGDVAYHWGTWTLKGTNKETGQKLELSARTVDVRRRQKDGTWKIVVDHASFFPAPPK